MQFPAECLAHLPEHGVWNIAPIGRNLTNATWRIHNDRQTYCVKQYLQRGFFHPQLEHAYQLDSQLASLGIAPQLVWSNLASGVCVFEWIAGPTLADEHDGCKRAQELGRTLARIHQIQPNLAAWSLRSRVEHYCAMLATLNPRAGARAHSDCASYSDLFTRWEQEPQVFCHHDLQAEHIFATDPIHVIDWEYAGYGHPEFDIASAIIINDLYEDEINELLASYHEQNGSIVHRDDLRDWLRLVALINRIWFELQEAARRRG